MGLPSDAIAVVGLAGRFPGAHDPDELWLLMMAGSCVVTQQINSTGELISARGLLHSIEEFDPEFFGISPREAILLDPQHRLLLECAWEALTDKSPGWREERQSRRTAVFMGVNHSGYRDLLCQATPRVSALEFESGTDKDFVATRIAYRLGLEGPSMNVQTACSTSLVAVHLACQSLLEFDADQALAGGASIVLPNSIGYQYEPRSIHSVDGICRPFDAAANGTVMGDGAGVVVLRRLEDAIEDGDRIYAVIRGSAINNDGARKVGYAAPSVAGQEEVIRAALSRAGFNPSEIGYVETHGTGTSLGDRVELQALENVFAESRGLCVLGSAKGAIGHLDTAAGVVGLIRCCLAVQHAVLPATVNCITPVRELNLGLTPFSILRETKSWESETIRRAGVSSFGVGGTNAHVVLEEYCGSPTRSERQTLRSAGYRPKRFWPEPASPGQATAAQVRRHGVEYLRAVWHQLPFDENAPGLPEYAQIVLIGDRDVIGETLHSQLSAFGIATTFSETIDSLLLKSRSRTLVVCTLALSDVRGRGWRAYDALTTMAELWSTVGYRAGLDVVLVTREALSVLGDECGDPALAALSGLARVLTMETPYVRVRTIDVQDTTPEGLARLGHELIMWRAEPLVVQRGRRAWCLRYEPVTVAGNLRFQPADDTVSVVIGSGQIGGAAARALVEAGHQIVLVARTGSTDVAARLAEQLASSQRPISVEECDMGVPEEVRELLGRIVDRYGAIDQLVHAAGISGEAAYQNSGRLPRWKDEEHFRVKIDGIAALAEVIEHQPVRRVVLMSSLAGTIGALSLGPYSAAAAAMNSYADRFNLLTTRWLSVGWDAWWRHDPSTAHEARMVSDGLAPDEAYRSMVALLASELSGHVIVSKGDFPARWDRFVSQPLRHATDPPAIAAGNATDSSEGILDLLVDGWRACLSERAVGADDSLTDLGADSLMWIEVLADVESKLGRKLPDNLFFGAATPRLLAERVSESLADLSSNRTARETVRAWGDDGPVVWCLHPVGGSADGFVQLARLLDNYRLRAVVGLPLAELVDDESVESIASRYFELLGGDSPPSVLVGWSFGAVIAFHLAQLVTALTGLLPPLVVLDMPAPMGASTRSIVDVSDAEIVAAIVSHRAREAGRSERITGWEQATDVEAFAAFIDQLRGDLLPAGFTVAIGRRMAAGYRRRLAAVERYRPCPYPGQVVLITAREVEFGETGLLSGVISSPTYDATWGWQSLSGEIVAVRAIEGHHVTLLHRPAVHDVADVVRQSSRT